MSKKFIFGTGAVNMKNNVITEKNTVKPQKIIIYFSRLLD